MKCCVGLCDEAPSQVRKKRSVAESVSHFTGGYVGLNEIDDLYLNDIDDDTIEISPMEQDLKLKEAELNCTLKLRAALTKRDYKFHLEIDHYNCDYNSFFNI